VQPDARRLAIARTVVPREESEFPWNIERTLLLRTQRPNAIRVHEPEMTRATLSPEARLAEPADPPIALFLIPWGDELFGERVPGATPQALTAVGNISVIPRAMQSWARVDCLQVNGRGRLRE
jgi:hypothetical protein